MASSWWAPIRRASRMAGSSWSSGRSTQRARIGVVGALAAQCAVAQLRGEAGVALVQPVVPDPGRQHEVGVGVLRGDGAQHFEGHEPGRIGPAGALGRGALGKAALRTAVAFPALRVPLAAVPAPAALAGLAPLAGPRWPPDPPRWGPLPRPLPLPDSLIRIPRFQVLPVRAPSQRRPSFSCPRAGPG